MIGRRKIDNYIMYFTNRKRFSLIDLGDMKNLHQGRDTYNQHAAKRTGDDYYYNSRWYNERNHEMSILKACEFRFSIPRQTNYP